VETNQKPACGLLAPYFKRRRMRNDSEIFPVASLFTASIYIDIATIRAKDQHDMEREK